ncbi:hypothetical protein D1872_340680 [compost metagenome]
MGIEATADTIGKIAVGAAVGGAVVHSIATNIAKKKEIREAEKCGEENEHNIKA